MFTPPQPSRVRDALTKHALEHAAPEPEEAATEGEDVVRVPLPAADFLRLTNLLSQSTVAVGGDPRLEAVARRMVDALPSELTVAMSGPDVDTLGACLEAVPSDARERAGLSSIALRIYVAIYTQKINHPEGA
jgi:hypothetical protein